MDYSNNYDSIFSGLVGGGLATFGLIIIGILLAYIIVLIVANWKLYKKAGKGGWECIIPVYSYWVLTEIAGVEWWWFLLAISDSIVSLLGLEDISSFANLVSIFASFNIYYNIAKKFGKANGTAVCAGLLSGIFVLIFGFSKNEIYDASIPVSKNGIFGTPEGNFNNNVHYSNNNMNNSTASVDSENISSTDTVNNNGFSYCGNCGMKLDKDVRFCPECGKENR